MNALSLTVWSHVHPNYTKSKLIAKADYNHLVAGVNASLFWDSASTLHFEKRFRLYILSIGWKCHLKKSMSLMVKANHAKGSTKASIFFDLILSSSCIHSGHIVILCLSFQNSKSVRKIRTGMATA